MSAQAAHGTSATYGHRVVLAAVSVKETILIPTTEKRSWISLEPAILCFLNCPQSPSCTCLFTSVFFFKRLPAKDNVTAQRPPRNSPRSGLMSSSHSPVLVYAARWLVYSPTPPEVKLVCFSWRIERERRRSFEVRKEAFAS